MADNVAQSIKNLQKNLEALDSQLLKSQQGAVELGNMIQKAMVDSGVSVDDFLKHLRNKLHSAQKENTIRLAVELTDKNGKPVTATSLVTEIEKVKKVIDSRTFGSKTKLSILGEEFTGADAIKRRYKELLAMQKMLGDPMKLYDDINRILNQSLRTKRDNSGTLWSKERAARMKEERLTMDKINKSIQKRGELEEKLEKYKQGSENWRKTKKAIEDVNKELSIQQRKLERIRSINDKGNIVNNPSRLLAGNTNARIQDEKRATQMINAELEKRRKAAERKEKYIRQLESSNHNARLRDEQRVSRMIETEMERRRKAAERYRQQLEKQKNSLDSMLPTLSRLASAFGVAFSVQGLVQFGKKLVETRGEFEMQFVAMKSIIGDVDAATKIWNQTLQQSLQSPKTFKELTTYTKQLAAYRIETEKLFDTTKRLADVSAGLGVDMGRLILAYGQVKAANYLRASEVRQFTESGVNIYGELAKYFSEIEGRAVGTAEVVERVSKRMVLFSDVEKIFQRMTDEGGTFFNMQEIQADTVLGQINKLHDAYDQMLNTIGQANQGTIRNLLETLNDLVRNWQNVAFVLKGNVNWITIIGAALYALSRNYLKGATTQTLWFSKAIMGNSEVLLKATADIKIFSKVLGDYSLKTRVAVVATRTLQGALSKLGNIAKAIWPLVVFEGAVVLIERLTRASRELKRFREELESVTSENVGRMNEEISGYDALIKKLQKTNEGTVERKEILNEITNKYGKYLDFIVTEKTTVEELAGAYDNVVSSIRNYTAEKIREEQQQRLEKGIYDEYQDLIESLTGARIADKNGNISKITKEQAKNIAKVIQQSLDEYGVADIQSILETYFSHALGFTSAGGENAGLGNIIRSYINEYNSLKQELQDIRNDIEGETPVFSSDAEYNDYKNRVESANLALAEQAKRNKEINDLIKANNKEQWQADDALHQQRKANAEAELKIRRQYNLITQKEYESSLARLNGQLDDYETDYNRRLKEALQSMSSFGPLWLTLDKDARDMYNYVVSTEDALQQGTEQRNKQLKESYQGLKESLKEYKEQLSAAQKTGAGEDAVKKIQSDIDWATLMIKALELAAKLRGIDLSSKNGTRTPHNYASISSLISLLKEMNSEYDKLSKSAYGFAKSNEKVVESFTPAFKEIFGFAGIDISQVDTTSKKSTADAMKLVIDKLDANKQWGKFGSDGGKKARQEFIKAWGEMAVEADIELTTRTRENVAKQLEEAFGDYQLTLDLQKLQLPSGLLTDMFDIDAVDLAGMRQKLEDLSKKLVDKNGVMTGDNLKLYEDWLKKLDDEERKLQQQRLKDYSKYLEYQLSERAKLEMEYVRKLAEVQSESAFTEQQKKQISDGLKREYEESIAKQDWEDFKGSEFYVGMMEDLSRQGTASLEVMRSELMKLRDNAENLSPRALKEMVNALEKIEEVERGRKPPFQRIREEAEKLKDIDIAKTFKDIADAEQRQVDEQNKLKSIQKLIGARQEEQKQLSLISKQDSDIQQMNIEYAKEELSFVQRQIRLHKENKPSSVDQNVFRAWEFTGNQLNARSESLSSYIDQLETLEKVQKTINSDEFSWAKDLTLEDLLGDEDFLKEQLKLTDTEITNLRLLTNTFDRLAKAEQDALNEIKDYISKVNALGKSVSDLVKNFGGDTNPVTEWWEQMGDTAVNSVTNAIDALKEYKDAVAKNVKDGKNLLEAGATGDYVRLALAALKIIVDVFAQIGLFRDARIDKEIEDQKEKIDQLTMAYDRLEKSIERTLSTSGYMANMHQMVVNIREQIEATEQQLALARSRKSVDNDEVRGYEKSLQDLYDQLDEVKQKQIEVFGGVGKDNYRSWAEGFVSAWKDAFLETGDGLDALQDHFDEFLQEWFVKQATMRIAGKALEGVMGNIDKVVSDNGDVDWDELNRIHEQMALVLPDLSERLADFAGMWDLGGEGGLSGLAAGIQGMTEEQANILEAYWNSVRMYTANINDNVARIASMLGVGGAETNPMLQQMSVIAENTAYIKSIYTMLDNSQRNLGQGKGFVTYQL